MKKSNRLTKKYKITAAVPVAAALWLRPVVSLSLTGCGGASDETAAFDTVTEDFFLQNEDGTYTYGEIVAPLTEESFPLVSISHGIYGTINSGGARQLSETLAENGIAAVRVDFNRCLTNDPDTALAKDKSGRVNEYTISDMLESNMLSINYALDNYNVDKDRIGVYGRSFGGRIAMIMGNESWGGIDYKAMALIAPAGNEYALIHYMGGSEKWDELRELADRDGKVVRGRLTLTPKWFDDYYKYNPALTGDKFGDKPVMVYYNTKDTVVEPKTRLDSPHA